MTIKCLLNQVDEKMKELAEQDIYFDELEVERDEENGCIIIAYDYKVIIPELNIYARDGEMLCRSGSGDEYMTDFSLALIYKIGSEQYLLWEQDSILKTLHYYLHTIDKSTDGLEDMECIIEYDE